MPGLDSPNPAGTGLDSPRLGEEGLELLGGPPTMLTMDTRHRRTINTEGKAKVVAAGWGTLTTVTI